MAKKLKIEKSNKKEKWQLIAKGDALLETDMITGAHTEIFSNNKITVEGCLGVFEYKDSYLKLKLPKGSLILCGSNFDIVFFENRLITVKGKISSVEFCM